MDRLSKASNLETTGPIAARITVIRSIGSGGFTVSRQGGVAVVSAPPVGSVRAVWDFASTGW